jgi:hypothetical protein
MINCNHFLGREKMSSHDSIRWRGILLFAAGIIWIASSLIHPSDFDPYGLLNPFWVPNAILIALAYFLIPFGVVGIQRTLIDQTSKLSRIGFILAIIGSLASVLTSLVFGFVAPVVARQLSTPTALFNLIKPNGQLMWAGLLLSTYILLFLPGCILVGRAVIVESALPRLTGWLLTIGVVMFSLGRIVPQLFILTSIGGVIFGISWSWLGYALWLSKANSVRSANQ